MTTIRIGLPHGHPMHDVSESIADALARHPQAAGLNCTLIIGIGALGAYSGTDTRPRVVLPLASPSMPREMMRAQLRHADAIVATDDAEVAYLGPSLPQSPVPVVVSLGPGTRHTYLSGATTFDALQAATTINSHPELAATLARAGVDLASEPVIATIVAAMLEAAVAAGAPHG